MGMPPLPAATAASASSAKLPVELTPYVKQLCFFLSYFPDKFESVGLMHELQQLRDTLKKRM
jgi:hypothetical protein